MPHAHLVVVPQHINNDIASARFAKVEDGEVVFSGDLLRVAPRDELDAMAELLRRGDS